MRGRRLWAAVAVLAAAALPSVTSATVPARAEQGCTPDLGDTPALAVGTTSCPGARPGAHVETPRGSCTANFVFEGSDGHRYLGTAGHCVLKYNEGDRTWAAGAGPWAKIDGRLAGHFVYATFPGDEDYALVRLDPDFPWSASMMHFGGPTGLYTDHVDEPRIVHFTGNALGVGNLFNKTDFGAGPDDVRPLAARSALAMSTMHPSWVYMNEPGWFGDSGAGVITDDGLALGTIVWIYADTDAAVAATTVATRIDYSIARAEQILGLTFALQTAPLNTLR